MQGRGSAWSLSGTWEPYAFAKALEPQPLFHLCFPFSCLLCLLSCPCLSPSCSLCCLCPSTLLGFFLSCPLPLLITELFSFAFLFPSPSLLPCSLLPSLCLLCWPQWFIAIKLDSVSYGGKRQLPLLPSLPGLTRCSHQAPSVAFIQATGEHFAALGRQSSAGTRRWCGLFGQLDIWILIELPKGLRGAGVAERGRQDAVGHGGPHAGTSPQVWAPATAAKAGAARQVSEICYRRDQKPLQLGGAILPSPCHPRLLASPVCIRFGERKAE